MDVTVDILFFSGAKSS